MRLRSEHLRISQMMAGLTTNWPIFRMQSDVLDEIEKRSDAGDAVLSTAHEAILRHLQRVRQPEDFVSIAQAYEEYSEASIYLLLTQRGLRLARTPGTGQMKQKRPDFTCTYTGGNIYIEVKSLDFDEGWVRHKRLAMDALDKQADLEERARKPGVHFGEPIEISGFDLAAGPADRIETVIKKIRGNSKFDQLTYGATLLVVDMGRLECETEHPSALLPVYFNDGPPDAAIASGELWHIACGLIGDMIYTIPEFAGKPNLDRPLKESGTLREFPELLGVSFVLHALSGLRRIYTICNLRPNRQKWSQPLSLDEHQVEELLYTMSDAMNDTSNSRAVRYQHRT